MKQAFKKFLIFLFTIFFLSSSCSLRKNNVEENNEFVKLEIINNSKTPNDREVSARGRVLCFEKAKKEKNEFLTETAYKNCLMTIERHLKEFDEKQANFYFTEKKEKNKLSISKTDLEILNTTYKTTKRPFLYVWGFDRIEKTFWKDELCKLSRLGIDYVHSYSNFRKLNREDLQELIITARECNLKFIFAIQPRENKFKEEIFISKLNLLSDYKDYIFVQIADEPRKKNRIKETIRNCIRLKPFKLRTIVQEGVIPSLNECFYYNGLHSHRRDNSTNKAFELLAKKAIRADKKGYRVLYLMRMFNGNQKIFKANMNFVDAKNEFCNAINLKIFEGIGFYTYNKKKNGLGIVNSEEIWEIFEKIITNYKNDKNFCIV